MPQPGTKKNDALAVEFGRQSSRDGRGDGWTLEQHLVEHQRLPSRVGFIEHDPGLTIRHRTPGRWMAGVGLAVLPLPWVGIVMAGLWPTMRDSTALLLGGAVVTLAVALLLVAKATAVTKVVLGPDGVRSSPWPPGSGERFTVDLDSLRRFKVGKTTVGKRTVYQLHLHTRPGEQHTLIPHVPLKRDAYLMAMLLIEHVKRLRAERSLG